MFFIHCVCVVCCTICCHCFGTKINFWSVTKLAIVMVALQNRTLYEGIESLCGSMNGALSVSLNGICCILDWVGKIEHIHMYLVVFHYSCLVPTYLEFVCTRWRPWDDSGTLSANTWTRRHSRTTGYEDRELYQLIVCVCSCCSLISL